MIKLENKIAALTYNHSGGAITEFRLKPFNINPLCFAFTKEQMPLNNRNDAPYQGHFLCPGHWGEPSVG